jgi:catalase
MSEDEKKRLIENIATGLAAVSRDDIIERSVCNFARADADYGKRLESRIKELRAAKKGDPDSIKTGAP